MRPDVSLPTLDPKVEVVTYQARTSDRVEGVVSCESIDLTCGVSPANDHSSSRVRLPKGMAPGTGEHSLLDTSKWPKVAAGDADHPHNRREKQDPEILKQGKD